MCNKRPCPQENPWLNSNNLSIFRHLQAEQNALDINEVYSRRLRRDQKIGRLMNGDVRRSSRAIDQFTGAEAKRALALEYPIVPFVLKFTDDKQVLGMIQVYPTSGEVVPGSMATVASYNPEVSRKFVPLSPLNPEQMYYLSEHVALLAELELVPLSPDIQYLQPPVES